MSVNKDIQIPNIGDFTGVEVIEINVKAGDHVEPEDPLLTLESDKASIDVPAPFAGTISKLLVKVGDRVSAGDTIATAELDENVEPASQDPGAEDAGTRQKQSAPAAGMAAEMPEAAVPAQDSRITIENIEGDIHTQLLVLGSGPGGYSAAFRGADLGLGTVLVERYDSLGGVCLNVGCIPSKALLHAARVISDAREADSFGIKYSRPEIELDKLRGWKDKVLGQLTNGLMGLAKQRKVNVVHGTGEFISPNQLKVTSADRTTNVAFEQAIIAVGSEAVKIPGVPADPRIIDSTGALHLNDIPERLLVIGGGIIGLEMATVYHELGSRVTVVEMLDRLIAAADPDIVKPLHRRIGGQYENIYLSTRVTGIDASDKGLVVSFKGDKAPATDTFNRILVAVGRRPNGNNVAAELAGVIVDERGFIRVDKAQRTNVPHIYAIGDITGEPMLAHKAMHEGKVAAEVAAGHKSAFDTSVIPSVAYTDPEVAWAGLTETQAQQQGLSYRAGIFPWAASGRSLSLGRNEGMTKLLFDDNTDKVIGAGIVGPNAGDLIAEVALAIEMGADAEDISLTVHPHPTLSETIAFAAEAYLGTITDLYMPRK